MSILGCGKDLINCIFSFLVSAVVASLFDIWDIRSNNMGTHQLAKVKVVVFAQANFF